MELLRLSIHQTYAQLGIQTHSASQEIHSPAGELSIMQPSAKMEIQSPQGELHIDSSAAWAALGHGNHLEWMNMIYSQTKSIVLQAIARTAQEGSRMAQITSPDNAISEIAKERFINNHNTIQYTGQPAYDNVKVSYESHKPVIRIEPQQAQIEYTPHKPEIQYNPGAVDIYIKQMNSIDIQVSHYDYYK
jgi:hypothetical protein